uniref:C2H2-type domain-containing protein n=1 Tax=Ditylenchus dipsaci TaxID=166011 RepID=A0A915CW74_9BILA
MSESNGNITVKSEPKTEEAEVPDVPSSSVLFCTTCAKQVTSVEYLREHISAHHIGYFPYQCVTCKNNLASMSLLKDHCFLRAHPEQRRREKLDLMLNHMLTNQYSVNRQGPVSSASGSTGPAFASPGTAVDSRKRKADDGVDYNGINSVDLDSLYTDFVALQYDLGQQAATQRIDVHVFIEDFVILVLNRIYGDALKHCTKKQKYVNKKKYCVPTRLADDIFEVLKKNQIAAQYDQMRQQNPAFLKQDPKSFIHCCIDRELSRAKHR